MNKPIIIRSVNPSDHAPIAVLIERQDRRLHELDSRLRPPRTTAEIVEFVAEKVSVDSLVAIDGEGVARGFAIPAVWEVAEDEEMSGFFLPRNGTLQLMLSAPGEPDAADVTRGLLDAVETWWQAQAVDGSIATWPVADTWAVDLLQQRGYLWDSATAVRPLNPMPAVAMERADLTIRHAQPDDEEVLVALHLEEIRFHEGITPHTRVVPALEPAFRQRLARVWRGESVLEETPIVLVAEQAGRVVGFTENWLSEMKGSWFHNGRYGYLNSVGVMADVRGQGIGRVLIAQTLHALAEHDIAGFYLYYFVSNPISSYFWPKMGFQPLLAHYKIKW